MLIEQIRALRSQARFAEISALIPYASVIGIEVLDGDDEPITVLRQRPSNIGNTVIRAVHGGVVGALLEHAAIMKVIAAHELDGFPRIINLSVDYLRPCLGDSDTFARGELVTLGRRIANVRVVAWQQDAARPVAAAHAHFLVSSRSGRHSTPRSPRQTGHDTTVSTSKA